MTKLRKIIHIDMDYFFAQVEVEEKANPSLKDKPFAVGGTNPKRGVISTCNYIAREYGVRSAMPTAIAMQKCPNLILILILQNTKPHLLLLEIYFTLLQIRLSLYLLMRRI
ncbi:DNA polymerase IV [Francisella tularensis subsp. tularensis WY-00W4114]|nr:impB/mucB/samB family protein [Francisella tularensis subsp. tularensis]AKH92099.1 DNA polymerase IV [Francisella tularensis subsp. tularensis WY-00W4114]EKM86646.1 DNA polymerase IV [Francisella tularensis subsp. tularensis 831]EKM86850.1 DNA polymerase IV [Francisella tularensis subsp. tularensis AS_713]EKM90972.1 DNA polymerase IV [Francisella tularensis subsp. tularensis 70102010]EKM92617.1 DNA polymerase IV [Francisella tularensis subsp. tularensis 80700103]EKT89785.1 DNA polymerase I